MNSPLSRCLFLLSLAALLGLAACGGDGESDASSAATAPSQEDASSATDEDDHDEDDHDDHDDHDDEVSAGLGAHEHGSAELSLAWADSELLVELVSPAINVFGFEHEPVSDEDVAHAAGQTSALADGDVLVVNAEAGCTLSEEAVIDHEIEGSHSEIEASWLYICEHPAEIRELDASTLFDRFPTMEDIDAQWVSPAGQSAGELSPSSPVLHLE